MSERLTGVLSDFGKPLINWALLLLISSVLYFVKIGSLIPATVFESTTKQAFGSSNDIITDALFAPIRLLQFITDEVTNSDNLYLRMVSAVFAITAGLLLYTVLKQWHTTRIALLTSIMFISSSWVLHHARLVNSEVMYLLVFPALMLVASWMTLKEQTYKLPLSMALIAIVLYVPGAWLFVAGGLYYFRKHIKKTWLGAALGYKTLSAITLIAALIPLIYSFVRDSRVFLNWLGIGELNDLEPNNVLSNIAAIPKELLLSGPDDPLTWLSGTPILDVFTLMMVFLGIYAYKYGNQPAREKILFTSALFCIILIAIGTTAHIGLLLPVIYLISANGIAYMLQAWFAVFPRNPFARSLGLIIVTITVLLSCGYQLQRYFVAWPNAPMTQSEVKKRT